MNVRDILSLFNLRDIEMELYEKMLSQGPSSASQIARQINITRTAVYDLLDKLKEKGLIYQTMKRGVGVFGVQSIEKVRFILEEKEQKIKKAQKTLDALEQSYKKTSHALTPRLQMFEGRNALQEMMKDLLLYRDITAYIYWPTKKMIELFGSRFFTAFHEERIVRNIYINAIWPQDQIVSTKTFPYLNTEPEFKREIRIAPDNTDFSLGYAIYDNTVRFISSQKENFGFLIESHELTETMKSQFQVMWKHSQSLKN